MCRLRPTRPRHPDADHLGWIRLQRPHITRQRLRLLLSVSILGLRVPLGTLAAFIQELPGPLPVKSLVFDDGLLLSAFATAGTLHTPGLGCLPLLIPGEVVDACPTPFPALLPLRGLRPPDIDIGTPRHLLTRGHGIPVGHTSLHEGRTRIGHAVMSSKTGRLGQDEGTGPG